MNTLINLQGMRFGKLLVLEKAEIQREDVTRWVCQCDCGKICVKRSWSLRSGLATDCGCSSSQFIDLTGKRFGKLLVIAKEPVAADGKTYWMCQCDCGNTCIVYSYSLRKGLQKSCGCGRRKDLKGQRFGNLTAIECSDKYIETAGRSKKYLWKCLCDCGAVVYRLPEKLRDDVYSACDKCTSEKAVAAMIQNAGVVEGTQLKKISSKKLSANNKSGVRGVFFNKRTGKLRAMLKFQGVDHYLGEIRILRMQKKQDIRLSKSIMSLSSKIILWKSSMVEPDIEYPHDTI